jgi:undecaprenyl phosphate-alpha-L-ara4N flippase subunit ArnE
MKFGIILFILSVLVQSAGQIMEKKGVSQLGEINGFSDFFSAPVFVRLITNPYIIGGVVLSVAGLLTWLGALSQFKLSYLYAIGSLSYIVVTLLSFFVLGEAIQFKHWIGLVIIIAGCVLVNLK